MVRIVSHGMFFGGPYELDLPPTKDAGLGWDSGRHPDSVSRFRILDGWDVDRSYKLPPAETWNAPP